MLFSLKLDFMLKNPAIIRIMYAHTKERKNPVFEIKGVNTYS